MVMLLKKRGLVVHVANNGKEAVDLYVKYKNEIGCILMDWEMPFMNGIEATKVIRKKDKEMPIIMVTAHSTNQDRDASFEAGANGFLSKPIGMSELDSVLEKHKIL